METEISQKSSDEKSQDLDNNATFFQIDNASSLNELLPGVSDQDKWITMLGENGLILTRSDNSADEQVQSSTNESVQNLLQNTTTSVISVGEGDNAESYIVIKAKPELSTPRSILAKNYQSKGQAETVVDINIHSSSGSTISDDIDAQNKLDVDNQDIELSTPELDGSVAVEEIHSSEFIQPAGESIEVEIDTQSASTSEPNKEEAVAYSMTETDKIKTQSFRERSNLKSIVNDFPKEKVENAIEELNEFINRGQDMNSNCDQESESKVAEAHRYLTEYVQQINESAMSQDKILDGNKGINEFESNDEDGVSNKREKNADEKLLVRKLKARTLSESEKVAAVEGLIQMSLSTANRQPDARKRLNDALKAGIKNIQRDNETFDAVEGLMEIGNTPMQQLEKIPKTEEIEKSQEVVEIDKTRPTTKTLKELLSKNNQTGMLMIKSLPYKLYRCVNCEQTFVNEDEVRAISRSADFRRLYMCHECHSSKQDGFLHKCRLCGAGFQAIRGLEQHFENHELKYIYRCDYCGKGFGYHGRNRYLSHERTHKGPNPCFCSICGMQFSRPVYLHMHTEKTHKRKKMHFCEICGQFFTSLDLLRTHYRAQHFCYDTTSSQVSDYRCGICNEVYPSLYMLNTHLVIHTRLSQGFEDMYECLVCNKRFKNVRNLQKHHLRLHPDQHLYNCHICNKEFQSSSVRDNHLFKAHDIKMEGIEDIEENKPNVKTELVVQEEIICESEEVIPGQSNLTQTNSGGSESQEMNKPVKGDKTVNLQTMTYKSDKIGDDSTTEVVFGGTDVEDSEPTILVEMKNPRLDTSLNKNSRKMMSLLTPQSLAKLQKAKGETGGQTTEKRDLVTSSEPNQPQNQDIVGSEILTNMNLGASNQESGKSKASLEKNIEVGQRTAGSKIGNVDETDKETKSDPKNASTLSNAQLAEQSHIPGNLEGEQIKVSNKQTGLEKQAVDVNIEKQKSSKFLPQQSEEKTGNINNDVKLDKLKNGKCASVKKAGESENLKQKMNVEQQNKVTTERDKMAESLNKGDNSQNERKRKTNGQNSETLSKQKKLNENSDKNVEKQVNDGNKMTEKGKNENDIKTEEVTGTRKSSRKIRHTWKYLESVAPVDSETEKSSNRLSDNRDANKEKLSSNTDTGTCLEGTTKSCSFPEKSEKIANSKFLSQKGAAVNDSKDKSDPSQTKPDQTCSVVLEDIGPSLSNSELDAPQSHEPGKLNVDGEMSAASNISSSWSEKFQDFVNQSSVTGKELKRKKMTNNTTEIDPGTKKIAKK